MKKFFIIFFLLIISASTMAQKEAPYEGERIPAVVNANNVNVRDIYGLSSNVLFTVNKGEYIYIIDQTKTKQKIGDWENVWYKVLRPQGDVFWIYGEFVTVLHEPYYYSRSGTSTELFGP